MSTSRALTITLRFELIGINFEGLSVFWRSNGDLIKLVSMFLFSAQTSHCEFHGQKWTECPGRAAIFLRRRKGFSPKTFRFMLSAFLRWPSAELREPHKFSRSSRLIWKLELSTEPFQLKLKVKPKCEERFTLKWVDYNSRRRY